jgi:hypothetical protein
LFECDGLTPVRCQNLLIAFGGFHGQLLTIVAYFFT